MPIKSLLITILLAFLSYHSVAEGYLILGDRQELAKTDSELKPIAYNPGDKDGISDAVLTPGNTLYYTSVDGKLLSVNVNEGISTRVLITRRDEYIFDLFRLVDSDNVAGKIHHGSVRDPQYTYAFVEIGNAGAVRELSDGKNLLYPIAGLKRTYIPDAETTFSTKLLRQKGGLREMLDDVDAEEDDEWLIVGQSVHYKLYAMYWRKKPSSRKADEAFKRSYIVYDRIIDNWFRLDVPEGGGGCVFDGIIVFKGLKPPIVKTGYTINRPSGSFYFLKHPGNKWEKIRIPWEYERIEVHAADKDHLLVSGGQDIIRVDIRDPKNPVVKKLGKSPFPIAKVFEIK